MNDKLLTKLRQPVFASPPSGRVRTAGAEAEWSRADVRFAADGPLEAAYRLAVDKLFDCVAPPPAGIPGVEGGGGGAGILQEGGVYAGCWLESTGTISAELLSRFLPEVSEQTYRAFALLQREDGLLPYKITAAGPAFRQIQLVTPLARCVWNHYRLGHADTGFMEEMYRAMAAYDGWLARHRNTRGTGCVEAFGAYDTGHDLSPRFWHAPDTPYREDAACVDPDSPVLPFLAPDLTANVYCQRVYMSRIAGVLGRKEEEGEWARKADESLDRLFRWCYDEADRFFYDRDRSGAFVRVQSDVLLRVLACEVGDRRFFDDMLRLYLLNTRKFFARYPFTSLAMDDPRFDPFSAYNTWGGPTNFLSLIRAAHAFEHHGRVVEFTWVMRPILSALAAMARFPQVISPWTGEAGFTEDYSPAILCLLDFVERMCGILPAPAGEIRFTGLTLSAMEGGREIAGDTGYARTVDGVRYELTVGREKCQVFRDGEPHVTFPAGLRVVTDRQGRLTGAVGMSVRTVTGEIDYRGSILQVHAEGNERLRLEDGRMIRDSAIGLVFPSYG